MSYSADSNVISTVLSSHLPFRMRFRFRRRCPPSSVQAPCNKRFPVCSAKWTLIEDCQEIKAPPYRTAGFWLQDLKKPET